MNLTNIVLVILSIGLIYVIYELKNKNIENFSGNQIATLREEINKQYNMDIEAIRNLGAISKSLLTGKNYHSTNISDPGTLTLPGSVNTLGNSNVTGKLSVGGFELLPAGSIIIWFKTEIPPGWVECDGQNGTPNLRNRFVLGRANRNDRAVGATGGFEKYKLGVSQLPPHKHHVPKHFGGGEEWPGPAINPGGGRWNLDGGGWHSVGKDTNDTGGGQDISNMPPYYVLIYIMKVYN